MMAPQSGIDQSHFNFISCSLYSLVWNFQHTNNAYCICMISFVCKLKQRPITNIPSNKIRWIIYLFKLLIEIIYFLDCFPSTKRDLKLEIVTLLGSEISGNLDCSFLVCLLLWDMCFSAWQFAPRFCTNHQRAMTFASLLWDPPTWKLSDRVRLS